MPALASGAGGKAVALPDGSTPEKLAFPREPAILREELLFCLSRIVAFAVFSPQGFSTPARHTVRRGSERHFRV
jgi:hypothetical protein